MWSLAATSPVTLARIQLQPHALVANRMLCYLREYALVLLDTLWIVMETALSTHATTLAPPAPTPQAQDVQVAKRMLSF